MTKNYVITDRLNPNAVSNRYGRPASNCGEDCEVLRLTAKTDAEAFEKFDAAIESGFAGYSERNTARVRPALWRTKAFHKGGKPLLGKLS